MSNWGLYTNVLPRILVSLAYKKGLLAHRLFTPLKYDSLSFFKISLSLSKSVRPLLVLLQLSLVILNHCNVCVLEQFYFCSKLGKLSYYNIFFKK